MICIIGTSAQLEWIVWKKNRIKRGRRHKEKNLLDDDVDEGTHPSTRILQSLFKADRGEKNTSQAVSNFLPGLSHFKQPNHTLSPQCQQVGSLKEDHFTISECYEWQQTTEEFWMSWPQPFLWRSPPEQSQDKKKRSKAKASLLLVSNCLHLNIPTTVSNQDKWFVSKWFVRRREGTKGHCSLHFLSFIFLGSCFRQKKTLTFPTCQSTFFSEVRFQKQNTFSPACQSIYLPHDSFVLEEKETICDIVGRITLFAILSTKRTPYMSDWCVSKRINVTWMIEDLARVSNLLVDVNPEKPLRSAFFRLLLLNLLLVKQSRSHNPAGFLCSLWLTTTWIPTHFPFPWCGHFRLRESSLTPSLKSFFPAWKHQLVPTECVDIR